MSFDKFLLAFESCDLSQADQRLQYIRLNSKRIVSVETICGNTVFMGQVSLIQMLPGELDMTFVKKFSSLSISVEGRSPITNPTEKITNRRRPQKCTET